MYIDDVYHATAVGSELDLTDVDRIEVLRGPQSTLSGNASIGGAIKIYTADPKGDDSGYLTVRSRIFQRALQPPAPSTRRSRRTCTRAFPVTGSGRTAT